MPDVSRSGAQLPRVPGHVAWIGGGVADAGGDAADADGAPGSAPSEGFAAGEGLAASEWRAVAELCAGALELGVRWLTVRVRSGAAQLREPLARALGPAVGVDVLEPWARHGGAGGSGVGAGTGGTGNTPEVPVRRLGLVLSDGGSGRGELVDAVRALADGDAGEVDEGALSAHLYRPEVPDPDLVVVTGGDHRVPDILVWEMAYSELVFQDAPWPAVDRTHLAAAVGEYQRRHRRYGGLVYQGDPR